MNNEFLPAYKVYQQVIDLELYYAFVDLVVHTSQEEKAWEIYRNIVDTQIWQQKAEGQNYFEAYNLRYPGEVLERDHRRKNRIGVLPNALKPTGWTVGRALCLCWMVVWPL